MNLFIEESRSRDYLNTRNFTILRFNDKLQLKNPFVIHPTATKLGTLQEQSYWENKT